MDSSSEVWICWRRHTSHFSTLSASVFHVPWIPMQSYDLFKDQGEKNRFLKPFHCQKTVSTVFWKCREDLCIRKPHCAVIRVKNNGNPVWMNGGRGWYVPVCYPTLTSLFLVGPHLCLQDIFIPIIGQMRRTEAATAAVHHRSQYWKLKPRGETLRQLRQFT